MEVAVACVAPAAGGKAVAAADLERPLDRLLEPVERHGDVLAQLGAELRRDREVTPSRQRQSGYHFGRGRSGDQRARPRRARRTVSSRRRAASSADPSASAITRKAAPAGNPTGNEAPAAASVPPSRYSSAATSIPLPKIRSIAAHPPRMPS